MEGLQVHEDDKRIETFNYKNKDDFKSMIENKSRLFSWEEEKCRNVAMALAMTSSDLTSGKRGLSNTYHAELHHHVTDSINV